MTTKTEGAIMVPMEVKYQPAWFTWVSAVTTCLTALGSKCDLVDVAGTTGYAFMISVHKQLCPSGPTAFNWGNLLHGVNLLARSTINFMSSDCYTEGFKNDRTREHARQTYDLVESEIKAGRPCVLWGAYIPEFAVVVGVDDGQYIVRSYRECMKEEQPPIKWDEIDAPGGPYMLGFPSPTAFELKGRFDRGFVLQAINLLTESEHYTHYANGLEAYDMWISSLNNNDAHKFGHAYNVHCYTEGRKFAGEFLKRVAERNEIVAEHLNEAVKHYGDASVAMERLAKLFPFPPGDELENKETRDEAVDILKEAKKAEEKAVKAMQKSVETDWGLTRGDETEKEEGCCG